MKLVAERFNKVFSDQTHGLDKQIGMIYVVEEYCARVIRFIRDLVIRLTEEASVLKV
jgi:hypothetical protein